MRFKIEARISRGPPITVGDLQEERFTPLRQSKDLPNLESVAASRPSALPSGTRRGHNPDGARTFPCWSGVLRFAGRAGNRRLKEPAELAVPAGLIQKCPALTGLEGGPAYNVGRAYAAFGADIDNGTHTVPDFADAVRRHEVIAAIERSAASGERVKA